MGGIGIAFLLLSVAVTFFGWLTYEEMKQKKAGIKAITSQEYKEYETAHAIALIWDDHTKIGVCDICGRDDLPVHEGAKTGKRRCKWCAELENLNWHLARNGVRRFKKEK